MTARTMEAGLIGAARLPWGASEDSLRYLWLGLGTLAALFSSGGRWDIGLAAWLAPLLLLRFSRMSRPAAGLGMVWLASVATTNFYLVATNKVAVVTILCAVGVGTLLAVPYVLDRLFGDKLVVSKLLLFPASIAAVETLLTVFSPFGASWGIRAITQQGNLPLLQLVAVTGPYGIGFLIGWLATTLNFVWENRSWERARWPLRIYAAVLLTVIVGGAARLAFVPVGADVVKIAGITPSTSALAAAQLMLGGHFPANDEELSKTDPVKLQAAYDLVNDDLIARTHQAAQAGAKIVVWSETSALSLAPSKPRLLNRASAVAREEHIYLNVASGQPFALNETHLIDPSGLVVWSYQKRHPVPGLEPIPPGSSPVPVLQTPYGRLSNLICFDGDFPTLARVKADIMLIPGNDWPEEGRSHTLNKTGPRAIENGYSLFRADANGLSGAFDGYGRVLASQDTTNPGEHMMIADLPIRATQTIYGLIGDSFGYLCFGVVVTLTALSIIRRRSTIGDIPDKS